MADMKDTRQLPLFVLIAGLIASLVFIQSCGGKERHLRTYFPIGIADNGRDTLFQTLIPFEVVNQEGAIVRTDDVLGSILVVDFFFASCPSVCPMMSSEMSRVKEAFAADPSVRLLSFSIDPDRDSVAALAAYATEYGGLAGKWDFLRGEGEENRTLSQRAFYLTALRDTAAEGGFQHDPRMVLLDKQGRIRGFYSALEKDKVNQLIEDVKWLLADDKKREKR